MRARCRTRRCSARATPISILSRVLHQIQRTGWGRRQWAAAARTTSPSKLPPAAALGAASPLTVTVPKYGRHCQRGHALAGGEWFYHCRSRALERRPDPGRRAGHRRGLCLRPGSDSFRCQCGFQTWSIWAQPPSPWRSTLISCGRWAAPSIRRWATAVIVTYRTGRCRRTSSPGKGSAAACRSSRCALRRVASAAAGLNSPLTLDVINFVDARAEPLPWRVRHGRLDIAPGDVSALPMISVGPGAAAGPLPIAQDGQLTVTVNISAVTNLGAATMVVSYDPAVVTVVACLPVGAFDGISCTVGNGSITVSLLDAAGFVGSTPVVELVFRSADGASVGDQTTLSTGSHELQRCHWQSASLPAREQRACCH